MAEGKREREREKEEYWNTDATEGLLETHCAESFSASNPPMNRRRFSAAISNRREIAGYIFKRKREDERKEKERDREKGGVTGQRETSAD